MGVINRHQFKKAISMAKEMIKLVQKEELAAHLADHYEVLARLYYALRDSKNAKMYARMAIDDLEKYGGANELDESIQEMREIAGGR